MSWEPMRVKRGNYGVSWNARTGKLEFPNKTRRPASRSSMILTSENPDRPRRESNPVYLGGRRERLSVGVGLCSAHAVGPQNPNIEFHPNEIQGYGKRHVGHTQLVSREIGKTPPKVSLVDRFIKVGLVVAVTEPSHAAGDLEALHSENAGASNCEAYRECGMGRDGVLKYEVYGPESSPSATFCHTANGIWAWPSEGYLRKRSGNSLVLSAVYVSGEVEMSRMTISGGGSLVQQRGSVFPALLSHGATETGVDQLIERSRYLYLLRTSQCLVHARNTRISLPRLYLVYGTDLPFQANPQVGAACSECRGKTGTPRRKYLRPGTVLRSYPRVIFHVKSSCQKTFLKKACCCSRCGQSNIVYDCRELTSSICREGRNKRGHVDPVSSSRHYWVSDVILAEYHGLDMWHDQIRLVSQREVVMEFQLEEDLQEDQENDGRIIWDYCKGRTFIRRRRRFTGAAEDPPFPMDRVMAPAAPGGDGIEVCVLSIATGEVDEPDPPCQQHMMLVTNELAYLGGGGRRRRKKNSRLFWQSRTLLRLSLQLFGPTGLKPSLKRGEYGAAPGNARREKRGIPPRKPAVQRNRQAQFPSAKIRGRLRRESNRNLRDCVSWIPEHFKYDHRIINRNFLIHVGYPVLLSPARGPPYFSSQGNRQSSVSFFLSRAAIILARRDLRPYFASYLFYPSRERGRAEMEEENMDANDDTIRLRVALMNNAKSRPIVNTTAVPDAADALLVEDAVLTDSTHSVCTERALARCWREVDELKNKRSSALNTDEHTTFATKKSKPDIEDAVGSEDDHEDSIDDDYGDSDSVEDDDYSLDTLALMQDSISSNDRYCLWQNERFGNLAPVSLSQFLTGRNGDEGASPLIAWCFKLGPFNPQLERAGPRCWACLGQLILCEVAWSDVMSELAETNEVQEGTRMIGQGFPRCTLLVMQGVLVYDCCNCLHTTDYENVYENGQQKAKSSIEPFLLAAIQVVEKRVQRWVTEKDCAQWTTSSVRGVVKFGSRRGGWQGWSGGGGGGVSAWLGALCLAVSLLTAPLVVALCRRKSTRLTAVLGGLVMALACLFTSFAVQMHQVIVRRTGYRFPAVSLPYVRMCESCRTMPLVGEFSWVLKTSMLTAAQTSPLHSPLNFTSADSPCQVQKASERCTDIRRNITTQYSGSCKVHVDMWLGRCGMAGAGSEKILSERAGEITDMHTDIGCSIEEDPATALQIHRSCRWQKMPSNLVPNVLSGRGRLPVLCEAGYHTTVKWGFNLLQERESISSQNFLDLSPYCQGCFYRKQWSAGIVGNGTPHHDTSHWEDVPLYNEASRSVSRLDMEMVDTGVSPVLVMSLDGAAATAVEVDLTLLDGCVYTHVPTVSNTDSQLRQNGYSGEQCCAVGVCYVFTKHGYGAHAATKTLWMMEEHVILLVAYPRNQAVLNANWTHVRSTMMQRRTRNTETSKGKTRRVQSPMGCMCTQIRAEERKKASQLSTLPCPRPGFNPRPDHSRIFACGNRAGRCRWSADFLGDNYPSVVRLHSGTAPYSPIFTLIGSHDLESSYPPLGHTSVPYRWNTQSVHICHRNTEVLDGHPLKYKPCPTLFKLEITGPPSAPTWYAEGTKTKLRIFFWPGVPVWDTLDGVPRRHNLYSPMVQQLWAWLVLGWVTTKDRQVAAVAHAKLEWPTKGRNKNSYGIVMGVGTGLVRETSSLMLGNYFKRRREFVEMVVQAGAGIGIALFSVFYKEAVG
ncbi:hypothetical protein PR048_006798 [Dryococelus australis]|uniref:Uncharacterized protein n=1 Tax=Dryococelus australis TaxID=614101 RepID=A0ABQ9IE63_9NEOP|nr:hypothetical protein PR048_006798 [Dryococelus australis]